MIDRTMAEKAMRDGLCAICAWCEHYWKVTDNHGLAGGCHQDGCGGPSRRRAFPLYQGPMIGNVAKYCFVCGKIADAGVQINRSGMIGVCNEHIAQLKELLNGKPGEVRPTIKEENVMIVDGGRKIQGNIVSPDKRIAVS